MPATRKPSSAISPVKPLFFVTTSTCKRPGRDAHLNTLAGDDEVSSSRTARRNHSCDKSVDLEERTGRFGEHDPLPRLERELVRRFRHIRILRYLLCTPLRGDGKRIRAVRLHAGRAVKGTVAGAHVHAHHRPVVGSVGEPRRQRRVRAQGGGRGCEEEIEQAAELRAVGRQLPPRRRRRVLREQRLREAAVALHANHALRPEAIEILGGGELRQLEPVAVDPRDASHLGRRRTPESRQQPGGVDVRRAQRCRVLGPVQLEGAVGQDGEEQRGHHASEPVGKPTRRAAHLEDQRACRAAVL